MERKKTTILILSIVGTFLFAGGLFWAYTYFTGRGDAEFNRGLALIDQQLEMGEYEKAKKLLGRLRRRARQVTQALSLLKRGYQIGLDGGDFSIYYELSEKSHKKFPGFDPIVQAYSFTLKEQGRVAELIELYKKNPTPNIISFLIEGLLNDFNEQDGFSFFPDYYLDTELSPELYYRIATFNNQPALIQNAALLFAHLRDYSKAREILETLPKEVVNAYLLTTLMITEGDLEGAEAFIKERIALNQNRLLNEWNEYALAGDIAFMQKKYQEAIEYYLEAELWGKERAWQAMNNRLFLSQLTVPKEEVTAEVETIFNEYKSDPDVLLFLVDNFFSYLKEPISLFIEESEAEKLSSEVILSYQEKKIKRGLNFESFLWRELNRDPYRLDILMYLAEYFTQQDNLMEGRVILSRIENVLVKTNQYSLLKEKKWYQMMRTIIDAIELRRQLIAREISTQVRTDYKTLSEEFDKIPFNDPSDWITSYNQVFLLSPIEDPENKISTKLEGNLSRIDPSFEIFLKAKKSLAKLYLLIGVENLKEGREAQADLYFQYSSQLDPQNPLSYFYRYYNPEIPPIGILQETP